MKIIIDFDTKKTTLEFKDDTEKKEYYEKKRLEKEERKKRHESLLETRRIIDEREKAKDLLLENSETLNELYPLQREFHLNSLFYNYTEKVMHSANKEEALKSELARVQEELKHPLYRKGYELKKTGGNLYFSDFTLNKEILEELEAVTVRYLFPGEVVDEKEPFSYSQREIKYDLIRGAALAEYETILQGHSIPSVYQEGISNQNTKIKWKGTPAQLAFVVNLLQQKGYIEGLTPYGERNAKILLAHFEIEDHNSTPESLGRCFQQLKKDELPINSEDAGKFQRIPHRNDLKK